VSTAIDDASHPVLSTPTCSSPALSLPVMDTGMLPLSVGATQQATHTASSPPPPSPQDFSLDTEAFIATSASASASASPRSYVWSHLAPQSLQAASPERMREREREREQERQRSMPGTDQLPGRFAGLESGQVQEQGRGQYATPERSHLVPGSHWGMDQLVIGSTPSSPSRSTPLAGSPVKSFANEGEGEGAVESHMQSNVDKVSWEISNHWRMLAIAAHDRVSPTHLHRSATKIIKGLEEENDALCMSKFDLQQQIQKLELGAAVHNYKNDEALFDEEQREEARKAAGINRLVLEDMQNENQRLRNKLLAGKHGADCLKRDVATLYAKLGMREAEMQQKREDLQGEAAIIAQKHLELLEIFPAGNTTAAGTGTETECSSSKADSVENPLRDKLQKARQQCVELQGQQAAAHEEMLRQEILHQQLQATAAAAAAAAAATTVAALVAQQEQEKENSLSEKTILRQKLQHSTKQCQSLEDQLKAITVAAQEELQEVTDLAAAELDRLRSSKHELEGTLQVQNSAQVQLQALILAAAAQAELKEVKASSKESELQQQLHTLQNQVQELEEQLEIATEELQLALNTETQLQKQLDTSNARCQYLSEQLTASESSRCEHESAVQKLTTEHRALLQDALNTALGEHSEEITLVKRVAEEKRSALDDTHRLLIEKHQAAVDEHSALHTKHAAEVTQHDAEIARLKLELDQRLREWEEKHDGLHSTLKTSKQEHEQRSHELEEERRLSGALVRELRQEHESAVLRLTQEAAALKQELADKERQHDYKHNALVEAHEAIVAKLKLASTPATPVTTDDGTISRLTSEATAAAKRELQLQKERDSLRLMLQHTADEHDSVVAEMKQVSLRQLQEWEEKHDGLHSALKASKQQHDAEVSRLQEEADARECSWKKKHSDAEAKLQSASHGNQSALSELTRAADQRLAELNAQLQVMEANAKAAADAHEAEVALVARTSKHEADQRMREWEEKHDGLQRRDSQQAEAVSELQQQLAAAREAVHRAQEAAQATSTAVELSSVSSDAAVQRLEAELATARAAQLQVEHVLVLKADQLSAVSGHNRALQDQLTVAQAEVLSQIQQLQQQLAAAQEEADSQIEELHTSVETTKQKHDAEVTRLNHEADQRLREWEEKHDGLRSTLKASKQQHDAEVSRLQQEADTRLQEREEEHISRVCEWEAKQKQLESDHRSSLEAAQKEAEERRLELTNEHSALHTKHAAEVTQHDAEIARLKLELDQRLREWEEKHDSLHSAHTATKKEHAAELQRLKLAAAKKMKEWEEKYTAAQAEHVKELSLLKREAVLRRTEESQSAYAAVFTKHVQEAALELESTVKKLQQEAEERLLKVTENHRLLDSVLSAQYNAATKKYDAEIARLKLEFDQRLREWEEKHNGLHSTLKASQQQHDAEVSRLQEEADARVRNLEEQYRSTTIITATAETETDTDTDTGSTSQISASEHDEALARVKQESLKELREWEEKHDGLHSAHTATKKEHAAELQRLKLAAAKKMKEWEEKHNGLQYIHNATQKGHAAEVFRLKQEAAEQLKALEEKHLASEAKVKDAESSMSKIANEQMQVESLLILQQQQAGQIRSLASRLYDRYIAEEEEQAQGKASANGLEAALELQDELDLGSAVVVEVFDSAEERRLLFPEAGELAAALKAACARAGHGKQPGSQNTEAGAGAGAEDEKNGYKMQLVALSRALDVLHSSYTASRVELRYALRDGAVAENRLVEQQQVIDRLHIAADISLQEDLRLQLISAANALEECEARVTKLSDSLAESKRLCAKTQERCDALESARDDMVAVFTAQAHSQRAEAQEQARFAKAQYASERDVFMSTIVEERRLEVELRRAHRQDQLQETRRLREELVKAMQAGAENERKVAFLEEQLLLAADFLAKMTS